MAIHTYFQCWWEAVTMILARHRDLQFKVHQLFAEFTPSLFPRRLCDALPASFWMPSTSVSHSADPCCLRWTSPVWPAGLNTIKATLVAKLRDRPLSLVLWAWKVNENKNVETVCSEKEGEWSNRPVFEWSPAGSLWSIARGWLPKDLLTVPLKLI